MSDNNNERRFQEGVKTLSKRGRVRSGAPYHTFADLKHAVRRETDYVENNPTVSSLTQEVLTVNKDILPFLADLTRELRKNFPIEGLSVILSGSNIHGGAEIRKITNSLKNSDFDYGLSADDLSALRQIKKAIRLFVNDFVERKKQKYKLSSSFHVCTTHDGNALVKNFQNSNQARSYLLSRLQGYGGIVDDSTLYFYPSMPSEVNVQNRQYLLEALYMLYQEDEQQWMKIRNNLVDLWKEHHMIKMKHFGGLHSKSEFNRMKRIDAIMIDTMAQPFIDIIDSTKTGDSSRLSQKLTFSLPEDELQASPRVILSRFIQRLGIRRR